MKESKNAKSIYEILTRREIQIIKLITDGITDKEIANRLNISFHTARTHHRNILQKTGQKCIGGLIRYALEHGLSNYSLK